MLLHMMDEVGGRGIGVLLGTLLGSAFTWCLARRRRMRERKRVLLGDARDTVVIHQHVIENTEIVDPAGMRRTVRALRIRTLGQSELCRVVPNGHLAAILLQRAREAVPENTLISMDGVEGSYLLETMTNFVCDRVATSVFDRDIFVMTACCEPAALAHHQPVTILLVRRQDLSIFENLHTARDLHVEHGSDGARILSLMKMAETFRDEQERIAQLRADGKRTTFMETMYVLDLALDQRCADLPVKSVPWDRYESLFHAPQLKPAVPEPAGRSAA